MIPGRKTTALCDWGRVPVLGCLGISHCSRGGRDVQLLQNRNARCSLRAAFALQQAFVLQEGEEADRVRRRKRPRLSPCFPLTPLPLPPPPSPLLTAGNLEVVQRLLKKKARAGAMMRRDRPS